MPTLFEKRNNKINDLYSQFKNTIVLMINHYGVDGIKMAQTYILAEINNWNSLRPKTPIKMDDLLPFECADGKDDLTDAFVQIIGDLSSQNFEAIKPILPKHIKISPQDDEYPPLWSICAILEESLVQIKNPRT